MKDEIISIFTEFIIAYINEDPDKLHDFSVELEKLLKNKVIKNEDIAEIMKDTYKELEMRKREYDVELPPIDTFIGAFEKLRIN